jgi:hypothetical protein
VAFQDFHSIEKKNPAEAGFEFSRDCRSESGFHAATHTHADQAEAEKGQGGGFGDVC